MKDKIISFVAGALVWALLVFWYNAFLATSTTSDIWPWEWGAWWERPDMSSMSEEEITEMKANRESMRWEQ